MNTSLKTRFAPSPTGLMHFGSLRTALFNYLYARRHNGSFLLRIEDTDMGRSEKQYTDAILTDLRWLGLEWQEGPYYQSERQAIYHDYYEILEKKGRVYPCFCTEEQLAITRKVQLASGKPPRYPGTCRQLSPEAILAKRASGLPFALRFEVTDGVVVEFEDLVKGAQRFETDHIGDFIIRRNDSTASFMFCNAIDDALLGVTHALRGDDHLTNTPRQILILQALELPIPRYGHFPTILGPDSKKLSKRNGSRAIQELREEGFLPLGLLNYSARIGHHDADQTLLNLDTLCAHFDLSHISSSPAHYDAIQLNHWQKEAMHRSTEAECWQLIAPYVAERVPEAKVQAFVQTVQQNLVMPKDALQWANAIFADVSALDYSEEIGKVIKEAGANFFEHALLFITNMRSELTFSALVSELQQKTGLKGKSLFFPLRAALTAELHGPELAKMLDLMGVGSAQDRLRRAADYAKNL
ncbi:MAG TPA: glutamate--tRNA ligase [Gammaproteobacteria bacterium]|nr:glutamate--tRNA ligase [Gammaproteobacteria bacterium]